MLNEKSLDTVCASICEIMGISPPENAAAANQTLMQYATAALGDKKADRVFMYNPDAIAQWVYNKYPQLVKEAKEICDIEIPLRSPMPSVTPVCFGTMYTGAQPEVHGIQAYVKPVIKIDTIFDAMLRSAKRPAIVANVKCSMGNIYLERDMDYFLYSNVEEINAKAVQLIIEDKHDFIAVYNGNYDSTMHKTGPESIEALSELRCNSRAFGMFSKLIENHWKNHNVLLGFAMDHGCHEIDGNCGSHGLDMEEDLNIVHLYKIITAQ